MPDQLSYEKGSTVPKGGSHDKLLAAIKSMSSFTLAVAGNHYGKNTLP